MCFIFSMVEKPNLSPHAFLLNLVEAILNTLACEFYTYQCCLEKPFQNKFQDCAWFAKFPAITYIENESEVKTDPWATLFPPRHFKPPGNNPNLFFFGPANSFWTTLHLFFLIRYPRVSASGMYLLNIRMPHVYYIPFRPCH